MQRQSCTLRDKLPPFASGHSYVKTHLPQSSWHTAASLQTSISSNFSASAHIHIAQEQVIQYLANEEQHVPIQSMGSLSSKWYCYSWICIQLFLEVLNHLTSIKHIFSTPFQNIVNVKDTWLKCLLSAK